MRRLRRVAGALLPERVRIALGGQPVTTTSDSSTAARIAYLEEVVRYLDFQVASQASLLRYLSAPVIDDLPQVRETKASFDFQWAEIPTGRYMLENEQFRQEAPGYVCEFTELPPEWFKGKSVIDAGCGLGRYSWALCKLGARVLSLDQSEHGLARTRDACKDFPSHRAMKVDLLHELPLTEQVDLVWSFGVLHHTGDTYGAFKHVAKWVKPGGMIYLMLYGKPREGHASDYAELNEYDEWRRRTRNMDLREKLHAVREHMRTGGFRAKGEEHVHGYFDAVSPPINDLYVFEEIEAWLIEAGFEAIKQTVQTRNLHIVATKKRDTH
jgi:SAM-dependent methyltransferase